jgi:hypothetical protein
MNLHANTRLFVAVALLLLALGTQMNALDQSGDLPRSISIGEVKSVAVSEMNKRGIEAIENNNGAVIGNGSATSLFQVRADSLLYVHYHNDLISAMRLVVRSKSAIGRANDVEFQVFKFEFLPDVPNGFRIEMR